MTTHQLFIQYHTQHPEVWQAWEIIAHEQALDPNRKHLSAGEAIESLRQKQFAIRNDFKPHYARLFNHTHQTKPGPLFKIKRLKCD